MTERQLTNRIFKLHNQIIEFKREDFSLFVQHSDRGYSMAHGSRNVWRGPFTHDEIANAMSDGYPAKWRVVSVEDL